MNLSDFRNKFLIFEKENDLFKKQIKGWYFWEYIRIWVYYAFQDELFDFKKGAGKWQRSKFSNKLKLILRSLSLTVLSNPFIKSKRADILIFTGSRRVKDNAGKDRDIYFDDLIDKTGKSVFVIEDFFQGGFYDKPATKNIAYVDFLYIFQKFLKIFSKPDHSQLNYILKDMEKIFGKQIKKDRIKNIFNNIWIEHRYFRQIYRHLINKIDPEIILETVSYGTWKMVFNSVAKKQKTPVIELQHGFMGQYQIPYNFEGSPKLRSFPDKIFTFGDFWNKTTDFPVKKKNIITTGFPNFEKKSKEFKRVRQKETYLFISQPTIAKGLSDIAIKLRSMTDPEKKDIIYKLHPLEYSEWKKDHPELAAAENIEVIDNSEKDLYYYFANSDHQVGVYSTALIEGLGFGLNTYIADLYGKEWMQQLIDSGKAVLIKNAEDILNKAANKLNREDIEIFWKSCSMKNLLNALDRSIYEQKR